MKNDVNTSGLISKKELAKVLGIHLYDLSRLVRQGRVPVALRLTRETMFFDVSIIEKFKAEQNAK